MIPRVAGSMDALEVAVVELVLDGEGRVGSDFSPASVVRGCIAQGGRERVDDISQILADEELVELGEMG